MFFIPRRGKLSGGTAAVQELRWRFWGKQRFSSCKLKCNLHTFPSKFKLKSKKVREVEKMMCLCMFFLGIFWRWVFLSGVENVDVFIYWSWYRVISRNIYWGLANSHAQVLHTIVGGEVESRIGRRVFLGFGGIRVWWNWAYTMKHTIWSHFWNHKIEGAQLAEFFRALWKSAYRLMV